MSAETIALGVFLITTSALAGLFVVGHRIPESRRQRQLQERLDEVQGPADAKLDAAEAATVIKVVTEGARSRARNASPFDRRTGRDYAGGSTKAGVGMSVSRLLLMAVGTGAVAGGQPRGGSRESRAGRA